MAKRKFMNDKYHMEVDLCHIFNTNQKLHLSKINSNI